jgi:hypothetical protein
MSKFAMIFAFVILTSMNISGARAAQTKSFSGKQLFDLCTSDQRSSAEFVGCVLYIKGFMAGLDLATTSTRRIPKTDFGGSLCLPNNLGAGEAAAAFVQCGAPQSVQRETLLL